MKKKQTLSVVVSVYNDEKKLARCLSSIKDIACEIIVIDNSSSDSSFETAKKFTSKVYKEPNHLMLNINKNIGFSKASSDWILNLDSDEEIPEELAHEIVSVVNSGESINGYYIKRKNILFNKWIQHGFWWPDKQLRLFVRGQGVFPCKHIHEYIEVNGKTSDLKEPCIHYNYDSISHYILKLERCTTSESIALIEAKYHVHWYDAIRFPVSDFLKIYFAEEGYRDGLHGLVLAIFQAFYSFTVFAKIWEKQGFGESDISMEQFHGEFKKTHHDIKYWFFTTKIQNSANQFNRVFYKIRRKLSI